MEIIEVTTAEYSKIFPNPYHVFGSGGFAELNRDKVEELYCFVFRDHKVRLGLTAGVRNNILLSPFSAPLGGLIFLEDDIKIQHIDAALELLISWSKNKSLSTLQFLLPPEFYHKTFLAKQINALHRTGFSFAEVELNYAFDLSTFDNTYPAIIWRNARKNLAIGLKHKLEFRICQIEEEKHGVYQVIQENRTKREKPLRMTWEQVKATTELIKADFFAIKVDGQVIGGAIVYHVSQEIVQVIYWGDLPEQAQFKTMNFLSYKVFEYYKNQGFLFVDLSHSTVDSVPNLGLCEFKESIGCTIQPKYILTKTL